MENLNKKFMGEIAEIKYPEIFLGVAKVLKVKIYKEDLEEVGVDSAKAKTPRNFTDIFADVMFAYDRSGRKFKRELLKILHDANRAGDELDGNNSKDSTKGNTNQDL